MKTCLVLGGADCLHDDIARYRGPVDGVVACNDAGAEWAGQLDAWITLHPLYWEKKGWLAKRAERGYPDALARYAHMQARPHVPDGTILTDYLFPGQDKSGSSGLFAAKVALIDLGFDRAVLCGVPLDPTPHFWDAREKAPWQPATEYRRQWLTVPDEYRARMRSMSGWTRVLLGEPEDA